MIVIIPETFYHVLILNVSGVYTEIYNEGYFSRHNTAYN